MTTALVSLVTGRKVRSDVAMTGEITLQGRVLPIGGVKQKALAAHRAGVRTVLFPAGNREDAEEIPGSVRDDLDLHFVHTIEEALTIALEPAPAESRPVAA
jgi:ATP-dependent Lon protease